MSTLSHESPRTETTRPLRSVFSLREAWAALAIIVMWIAVLIDALYGPDFTSTSPSSSTTIPSAVFLALFALLATRVVAKYGFGGRDQPPD